MEAEGIEIRWSNHAVVRAYKRFGRYTMELINDKVIKAIERQDFRPSVSQDNEDTCIAKIKLGKKKCAVCIKPLNNEGTSCLITTIYPMDWNQHRRVFSRNRSKRSKISKLTN